MIVSDETMETQVDDNLNQATGAEDQSKAHEEQTDSETEQVENLTRQLQLAEEQAEEYLNLSLRAKADAENAMKRMVREADKLRKYANEEIILRLFEVKDSLELGLKDHSDKASLEDIQKGLALTLKSLQQILTDFKVEEINPAGQNFDPELHQAVSTVETSESPHNTVIDVLQKGYRLNERLLRPAMVVVAKATGQEKAEKGKTPPK